MAKSWVPLVLLQVVAALLVLMSGLPNATASQATAGPTTGAQAPVVVNVVDVLGEAAPFPIVMAVQVCAGLFNKQPDVDGAAYVILKGQTDWDWLADVREDGWIKSVQNTTVGAFLSRCLASPVASGYIRYNYSSQHLITPQILTVAGVLDAVPLEDGSPYIGNATKAFDAVEALGSNSSLRDATRYMYDRFVNLTTTMAFMDPGFSGASTDPFAPVLNRDPNPSLIDFIVKERLFNLYMVEACIPTTEDYALMEEIATANPWPLPIAVFGYDDTFPLAGDLFEAETTCVKAHNMGQVASDGASNLAFFSIQDEIVAPLPQNPAVTPSFNASKTYLALTVGDGDNLSYLQGSRRGWMQQRVQLCQADPTDVGCFPLLWTISPHLLRSAPGWLRWFYKQANATGRDWFVLPPSGHLYAYPSEMPDGAQEQFVLRTQEDARLLSTSATVAWEVAGSWEQAIDGYFPRYSQDGVVQGFFAVNVPFMLPVLPFLDGEFFKILGNSSNVVLFRPREWRGTNATQAPPLSNNEYLTAAEMAKEVNEYPRGTATQIYVTSDGGANLDTIYSLIPLLEEHVQLVDHQGVVAMALASHSAARHAERASAP